MQLLWAGERGVGEWSAVRPSLARCPGKNFFLVDTDCFFLVDMMPPVWKGALSVSALVKFLLALIDGEYEL